MKPLKITLGEKREELLTELAWSIMKWLYHHWEKQIKNETPEELFTEFVNFELREYKDKLNQIYVKYPKIKERYSFFEATLKLLCSAGLIKSTETDIDPSKRNHRVYALTQEGNELTEHWYKTNGGALVSYEDEKDPHDENPPE